MFKSLIFRRLFLSEDYVNILGRRRLTAFDIEVCSFS
jgi:hypothetical protein